MGHIGKTVTQNIVSTSEITDGTVTGDDLASDIAISTSGAITTTGAFTSKGIDDNGDATTMTIDTSENVGIGNTSPSSQYMTRLVVGDGSGTEGITIYSGNDSAGRLEFSDATSGDGRYAGGVVYEHNNNALRFNTNGGNERMRIDANGAVTKPNQPMLYTHGDTTRLNVANGYAIGTYHTLLWASPQINVGNDFASNVYTCPVAGKYKVDVQATIYGSNGGYVAISIVKNSSQMSILYWDTGTLALWQTIANSLYINASASDTIYARVYYTASSHQVHEGSYRTLSIALVA